MYKFSEIVKQPGGYLVRVFQGIDGFRGRYGIWPTKLRLGKTAYKGLTWHLTVYSFFRKLKNTGLWKAIMDGLRSLVRILEGKSPNPTAGIIDSRTNKAQIKFNNPDVGYDAGKKTKGRKQHIMVDTLGLPIAVQVHSADIQDRNGAKPFFEQIAKAEPTIKILFADGGYAGKLVDWANETFSWNLEIVKRSDLHKFVILRKRWI